MTRQRHLRLTVLLFCIGIARVNADPALGNPLTNASAPAQAPEGNYRPGPDGAFLPPALLKHHIQETERQLESTNLDAKVRPLLEAQLNRYRRELTNAEEEARENAEEDRKFQAAFKADPRSGWTNMPNPIVRILAGHVRRYESELSDPSLTPDVRKTDEQMLAMYKQQLADQTTNAQLWQNLNSAITKRDSAGIDESKKQLASYLDARLGAVQGKKYPTNMSYDAVMAMYAKESGNNPFDRRKIVIAALALVAILPIVIIASRIFWRRRKA